VVVAEQVQAAVDHEQQHLLGGAVPGGAGLLLGDLRAHDDVADQPGA
jgi:hypothetical protein